MPKVRLVEVCAQVVKKVLERRVLTRPNFNAVKIGERELSMLEDPGCKVVYQALAKI